MIFDRLGPLLKGLSYLVILLGLICLNWWAFRRFLHQNYLLWYLKNGALISLATAFLAPTWTEMRARVGLISPNPRVYCGSCLVVLGVFVFSLSTTKSSQKAQPKELGFDIGLNVRFVEVFDAWLFMLLSVVMGFLGFAWALIVAPLAYFVTLIAGVPARQKLRGKLVTTSVDEDFEIFEPDAKAKPARSSDLSFARDPFAVTQALTALTLWLASIIYSRVS